MRDPGRLRLSAATPSGWLLFCARSCESRRHSAPGLCVPPKDRRNALAGLGIVIAGSIVRRSRNDLMWYYAVRRIMLAIPIAIGVTIIVAVAIRLVPNRCVSTAARCANPPSKHLEPWNGLLELPASRALCCLTRRYSSKIAVQLRSYFNSTLAPAFSS